MDPLFGGLLMGGGSLLQGIGGMMGSGIQAGANQNAGQMGWLGALLAGQAAEQGFQRAQGALSPYSTAGSTALNTLMSYLQGDTAQKAGVGGGGPNLLSTFAPTMEQLESTPGYKWARDQALGAMANSGAARGLGSSGNLVQQIGQTATGMASQTFQQQLENFMKQNRQTFDMLYAPAGLGASAAGGIANAAMGTAGQVGNAAMGGTNALAGGIMGQANAQDRGINALSSGLSALPTYGGFYGAGFNTQLDNEKKPAYLAANPNFPSFANIGSAVNWAK